jgi:hypothetical protein
MIAGQQHHITLFCAAVPAIHRFACFPVCGGKVTVKIDAVRICAQPKLATVRVYGSTT